MAAARGVSTYHLRCFVARAGAPEIDVDFLRRAIRDRGGRVIESRLRPPDDLASRTELALRGQWMHHFFPEARVLYGEDPVIAHYLERHDTLHPESSREVRDLDDPRIKALLERLLEPIRSNQREVEALLARGAVSQASGAAAITRAGRDLYRPYVENALAFVADGRQVPI
ncbi:MAG: hypothetical protein JRG92_23390 [Deltaproteobacteria bacterium]|nr:hypothetical protein [Deltaproteobacteria bacterium]